VFKIHPFCNTWRLLVGQVVGAVPAGAVATGGVADRVATGQTGQTLPADEDTTAATVPVDEDTTGATTDVGLVTVAKVVLVLETLALVPVLLDTAPMEVAIAWAVDELLAEPEVAPFIG
jgi:hypothetical protein